MSLKNEDYKELYEIEREWQRQQSEADYQKREAERQQRKAEERYKMRHAEDWDDVWHKSRMLLEPEASREKADNERYRDDPTWYISTWFQDELAAQTLAKDLFIEQMRAVSPRIREIEDRAQREIQEIELGILANVAQQVDEKHGSGTVIAEALRNNNPQILLDW